MTNHKILIKDISLDDLKGILISNSFESYRAEQIFDEIFLKRTNNFQNMTLIPKELRNFLDDKFLLNDFKSHILRNSIDGSTKFLFTLQDGYAIETVFMPWLDEETGETERNTLCISTMAGCPLDCAFCATAALGYKRKLTGSEIVQQILQAELLIGEKITNIVYMGMGEPLLNFNNTINSIRIITKDKFNLISRKRITLSTAGITNRIIDLTNENLKIKLALSLHATTDLQRTKIMKNATKTSKLNELLDAMEYYYKKTHTKLTYEYIPFDGFNDTKADALRLVKISRRCPSTINIIPFNDISHTNILRKSDFILKPSPQESINNFVNILKDNSVVVNVRKSFGQDIAAACGQLALTEKNKN